VRVTFPRVVAAEWRKMGSLRSTWWTLGVFVVVHAGFGAMYGLSLRLAAQRGQTLDQTQGVAASWVGITLTQLALVVLAVLTITAEYSSGQIRNTLMAVPTRTPVLAAKVVVLVAVTLVAAAVACLASVGLAALVGRDHVQFTLSTGQTVWQLAAGPLYLAGIVLFGFAAGALIRNSAAAMATIVALLLIVQNVLADLPFYLTKVIAPWLPGLAGEQMFFTDADLARARATAASQSDPGAILNQWQGFVVLLAWGVVFWVLAVVLLRRRDA